MAQGYRPPPIRFFTPRQLNRQANRQTRQSIKLQQAPIVTAQAAADARAAAAQKAIQGFGLAAAGILKDSAGQIPQAYRDAAQADAGLAAGFSKQAGDAVRARVAQGQATIDRLAPGGRETAPNTGGMQDAVFAQGGYVPGASNEAQAAAAETYGLEQPAIQVGQTEADIRASQAKQAEDDQTYVQQMLQVAAQEPQLRSQIMQQLQSNEMAKRSAYIQQQAQNMVNQRFNVSAGQAQQRINQEQRRINISQKQGNARIALSQANLRLSQNRDRQAVRQALIAGHRIDASASHAAGYLIDHNGNPITGKSGKHIPVKSYSSSGTGGGGPNTGPGTTAWKEAIGYAQSNYIQKQITPGVPDPLFNRPPFPRMQTYLHQRYGITRAQARKLLVGMGIKPDGKRPGK